MTCLTKVKKESERNLHVFDIVTSLRRSSATSSFLGTEMVAFDAPTRVIAFLTFPCVVDFMALRKCHAEIEITQTNSALLLNEALLGDKLLENSAELPRRPVN